MSDLAKFVEWVLAHPDAAKTATGAAAELLAALRRPPGGGPARTFTGIPSADRALAEAAGIAEIAGKRGVNLEQVLDVAKLLVGIAGLVL